MIFLLYFGYSTFFGYKFRLFRVNSDISITFLLNQVQIKKVTLNQNLKKGVGALRDAQRVEIGVLGQVMLGQVRLGQVRLGLYRLSQIYKRISDDPKYVKYTPYPIYFKDVIYMYVCVANTRKYLCDTYTHRLTTEVKYAH